jgi:hypothetical protein
MLQNKGYSSATRGKVTLRFSSGVELEKNNDREYTISYIPNILSLARNSSSRLYLCSSLHGGVEVSLSTETGWRGRVLVDKMLPGSCQKTNCWSRPHGGLNMEIYIAV